MNVPDEIAWIHLHLSEIRKLLMVFNKRDITEPILQNNRTCITHFSNTFSLDSFVNVMITWIKGLGKILQPFSNAYQRIYYITIIDF